MIKILKTKRFEFTILPYIVSAKTKDNSLLNGGFFLSPYLAWTSDKNELFIWVANQRVKTTEYFVSKDNIITCGCVRSKTGVFNPLVKYLVVVCTESSISLLGVYIESASKDTISQWRLCNLPNYSVPTKTVAIKCVGFTNSHKVLLGGQNGRIYEMQYKKFSENKKNCSLFPYYGGLEMFLANLVPFMKYTSPIKHLVSRKSTLNIIYITDDGYLKIVYPTLYFMKKLINPNKQKQIADLLIEFSHSSEEFFIGLIDRYGCNTFFASNPYHSNWFLRLRILFFAPYLRKRNQKKPTVISHKKNILLSKHTFVHNSKNHGCPLFLPVYKTSDPIIVKLVHSFTIKKLAKNIFQRLRLKNDCMDGTLKGLSSTVNYAKRIHLFEDVRDVTEFLLYPRKYHHKSVRLLKLYGWLGGSQTSIMKNLCRCDYQIIKSFYSDTKGSLRHISRRSKLGSKLSNNAQHTAYQSPLMTTYNTEQLSTFLNLLKAHNDLTMLITLSTYASHYSNSILTDPKPVNVEDNYFSR
jgi:hypothetical protein